MLFLSIITVSVQFYFFRIDISLPWHHIPDSRHQIPECRGQTPDTRNQTPDTRQKPQDTRKKKKDPRNQKTDKPKQENKNTKPNNKTKPNKQTENKKNTPFLDKGKLKSWPTRTWNRILRRKKLRAEFGKTYAPGSRRPRRAYPPNNQYRGTRRGTSRAPEENSVGTLPS